MKEIKIAIVTPFYEPSIGGIQQTMRISAEYLVEQGMKVKVFTSQFNKMNEIKTGNCKVVRNFVPHEVKNGVDIQRFDCGGVASAFWSLCYALCYRIYRPASNFFHFIFQMKQFHGRQMLEEILNYNPDFIFAAPAIDVILSISLRAASESKAKVLVHTALHLNDPHAHYMEKLMAYLRKVDVVLTNTEYEREFLISKGISSDRVKVHGPGLDYEPTLKASSDPVDQKILSQVQGKKYILYFGRKQVGKGADTLVDAVRLLRNEFPDLYVVLAGEEGGYKPSEQDQSFLINISSCDLAAKRWLMNQAYAFSMVSNIDSFGIVYCESWLSKKPVIGADNTQMRCVIQDGKDGFLIPYGNVEKLAEKIRFWLQNPSEVDRMGENGFQKIQKRYGSQAWEKNLMELALKNR